MQQVGSQGRDFWQGPISRHELHFPSRTPTVRIHPPIQTDPDSIRPHINEERVIEVRQQKVEYVRLHEQIYKSTRRECGTRLKDIVGQRAPGNHCRHRQGRDSHGLHPRLHGRQDRPGLRGPHRSAPGGGRLTEAPRPSIP